MKNPDNQWLVGWKKAFSKLRIQLKPYYFFRQYCQAPANLIYVEFNLKPSRSKIEYVERRSIRLLPCACNTVPINARKTTQNLEAFALTNWLDQNGQSTDHRLPHRDPV